MLWRRGICPFWYCCYYYYYYCCLVLESSSLALSASGNSYTALLTGNERTVATPTTRLGMPPDDHRTYPRWDHPSKPNKNVVLDCQCGRIRVTVPHADIRVDPPPPPSKKKREGDDSTYHAAVDCHCPSCRKYHVADRASYLLVPADKVEFHEFDVQPGKSNPSSTSTSTSKPLSLSLLQPMGSVPSSSLYIFQDSCRHLGPVLRYQCAHCRTKIATQPRPQDDQQRDQHRDHRPYGIDQYFLNLASIRDDSLPQKWTRQWRAFRYPWQYANQCVWTRARAESEYDDDSESSGSGGGSSSDDDDDDDEKDRKKAGFHGTPHRVSGSCACGTYRYQINYPSIKSATTELQHCYCQLCRRLSGGPFQTWMPAPREYFTWLPRNGSDDGASCRAPPPHEPPLYRYTNHGRRHVCDNCGGVLTIVYDADGEDVVWPAAGGIDDSCLPPSKEEMSKYLYGVCHICCRYRQSWYALPNDGNSRISEAS